MDREVEKVEEEILKKAEHAGRNFKVAFGRGHLQISKSVPRRRGGGKATVEKSTAAKSVRTFREEREGGYDAEDCDQAGRAFREEKENLVGKANRSFWLPILFLGGGTSTSEEEISSEEGDDDASVQYEIINCITKRDPRYSKRYLNDIFWDSRTQRGEKRYMSRKQAMLVVLCNK